MGGDHGPHVTVPAALAFQARHPDVDIVLVGQREPLEDALRARAARAGARLRLHPASEVVAMDEPPAQAMRYKKDSSMRVARRSSRTATSNPWSPLRSIAWGVTTAPM